MCNQRSKFACKNGREVMILFDEVSFDVDVQTLNGETIGGFRFAEEDDHLVMTWAHLDQRGTDYVRQGIGRRCLKLVSECTGMPVVARDNDGMRRNDGSHLTGDAPAFVARMRTEGLIV